MFSAHYNRKPESAADHASLNTPSAEGRLGNLNFIHFLSQPSRSTNKKFKRATPNACGNVRFHHTSTVIGSNAFIIGGQCSLDNSSTSLATTLLKMDFSTLVVNEKNSTIVPVTGHGAVPINDSKILILFGKESIAPPKLTNIVQQMDVQTGVVNTFNINGTAPPARYAHTVALIDNKVYTIGGINKNNDILGEITIIDLISKSWNIISKNSLPPIAGHSTVIVDKYLISCFGFNPKFELRNDCNVFDTVKNVYVQSNISGTPPSPRSYSTMVTKDDDKKIYVFGGFDKDYQGNNDLYILDAKNIPSLSWSPIPISADSNQNLMPSPRGAHTAIIKSEMMFILGGYSGKNLTDNETYIFNVKSSTWVDPKSMPSFSSHSDNLDNSKSFENSSSNSNSFPIWGIIVGAIGVIIMILIAIICFLSIRRRRLKVNSIEDKESQSDPYGKLPSNDEIKEIKSKDSSILEQITLELIPPLQLSQDMEEKQKENESKSLEIHSNSSEDLTSFKFSSEKYKIDDIPSKRLSTESQRMKRTHRRTSSVSLTPTDVASLTRPRSFVHHKSSLSTSVINNCSRKTSSLSNEFDPISATINSNDSLSATTLEKNHIRDSKATCRSARSVNSLQWVGFNNIMMAEQEEKRLSLHVRNALSTISTIRSSNTSEDFRKSTESEDDNDYVIFGDYIDTTPKYPNNINNNIHQSNSIDNNGLQKRSSTQNQSKIEICRKTIANIDEDDRSTRESGIIDNYMHKSQNYADSNYTNDNDDNDKRSSKKSKRSSKRASKVSFALTDEKIEYYETESSKSVGFARISGRTSSQSSSSSSSTPSIIEEEEEEDNNGKDDQERNKCLKSNSPVRNSIKELMMEQGIHKLYNI